VGSASVSLCGGERDGERRYAQELWFLASVRLKYQEVSAQYGHLKVWREGLEVAIKIKGSQGRPRIESVKPEHPFTAISPASEVHANHNEALNSSIRRRCSAYRRRQNHYAKTVKGLQRAITVQLLIHNWIRPHWGLDKGTTPAFGFGLLSTSSDDAGILDYTRVFVYHKLGDQCQKLSTALLLNLPT